MIFAAATDEMSLAVFSTTEEAIARCEGIDVEEGGWLFWNEAGTALNPEFLTPNHRGRFAVGSGTYRLVQAPLQPTLAETLAELRYIDANPHFATFSALRAHLTTAASLLQHGA